MRNWIVTLVILTLPIAAYLGLKNNKDMQNSIQAQAANKPSVIKFSSPMCLDCKKIKGEIDTLKPIYQDKINFVEIDATSNEKGIQKQIDQYEVTVVPTIIFLDENNYKVQKLEGFSPKEKIEELINELING